MEPTLDVWDSLQGSWQSHDHSLRWNSANPAVHDSDSGSLLLLPKAGDVLLVDLPGLTQLASVVFAPAAASSAATKSPAAY